MVNTNNHISEELDKNLDEMEFLKQIVTFAWNY